MPAAEKSKTTAADRHPVTAPTMRRMHAAMHQHGLTTDDARHAYLSALLERDVDTAKDLTEAEGRRAVDDLAEAPHAATPAALRKLRAPFDAEAIGKLPRITCKACRDSQRKRCDQHQWVSRCEQCGNSHSSAAIHLDYVGHADVTARLLEVDPAWSWEPFSADQIAALSPALRGAGLWINLTVLGITRPGFGDADGKTGGNAVKEQIGDALRNAAMRFGVALDLWAKGDRDWLHTDHHGEEPTAGAPPSDPSASYRGPDTQALLDRLSELAIDQGTDPEHLSAKWRDGHGGLSYEALAGLEPWHLQPLITSIEDWISRNRPAAEQQKEPQPA